MATSEETQTDPGGPGGSLPLADQPVAPASDAKEGGLQDQACDALQLVANQDGGAVQPGQWLGLVGAMESQAQAQLTDNLEEAIQQAAQTQLDQYEDDQGAGGELDQYEDDKDPGGDAENLESLATTLPWHAWNQALYGGGKIRTMKTVLPATGMGDEAVLSRGAK